MIPDPFCGAGGTPYGANTLALVLGWDFATAGQNQVARISLWRLRRRSAP